MSKHFIFRSCFILITVLMMACQSDSSGEQGTETGQEATIPVEGQTRQADNAPSESDSDMKAADKDNPEDGYPNPITEDYRKKSYAQLLEGKWANQTTVGIQFHISGGQLEMLRDNKPISKDPLEIHLQCGATQCTSAGLQQSHRWCFTAGSKCYEVQLVGQRVMKITDAETGTLMEFKRMNT